MKKLRQLHDEGGVRIAPNVGEMLRKEIQGLHSAGFPSENLIRGMDLDGLFGMTFEDLSTARRDALLQTETDFSRDIDALAVKTNMLLGRFGGTTEGTTEEREAAYRSARSTIAHDRDFVCEFFADFVCRGNHAPSAAPLLAAIARSDAFGPAWTIYRWVQVQLLYGLELAEKHGRLDPEALGPRHRERLQHDAIDMEYLVLAVLQGALASKDKRMRRLFTLLCPEGAVLPSPADS